MLEIVTTINDIKTIIREKRTQGKSIGLVPTMGYLHKGHLSLIDKAKEENDFVVVSIFVNPKQFGPNEDYNIYPRDIDRDKEMADQAGAHLIFHPTVDEMYPKGHKTYVEVMEITDKLCGGSRPGHFKGVTTVVNKLFNIVNPDNAYFGWKDAQQVIVIERMVKDLNMDIKIIPCPIVREEDGLAMSSRNIYLSKDDRKSALILSKSLFKAKEMVLSGERNSSKILDFMLNILSTEPKVNLDYLNIVDLESLENIDIINNKTLIAIAAKIGNVRLIDNIVVEV